MELNMAKMKAEAVRVHNLMRVQKSTLTKYVTKCLLLLELFKKEQDSVPLLIQAASEVITFHGRTTDQLNRLEVLGSKCADLYGG